MLGDRTISDVPDLKHFVMASPICINLPATNERQNCKLYCRKNLTSETRQ